MLAHDGGAVWRSVCGVTRVGSGAPAVLTAEGFDGVGPRALAASNLPPAPWSGTAVLLFRRAVYFSDGSDGMVALLGRGLGSGPAGIELEVESPLESLGIEHGARLEHDGEGWFLRSPSRRGRSMELPEHRLHGAQVGARRAARRWWWRAGGIPSTSLHSEQLLLLARSSAASAADPPASPPAEGFGLHAGGASLWSLVPMEDRDPEWVLLFSRAGLLAASSPSSPETAACALRLLGVGSGSTPSGDDLLVGYLAGLARRGLRDLPMHRALAANLAATCRLSRHFLHHALAGRFEDNVARLARTEGPFELSHPLVARIAAQGDRSGRALLAGFAAALCAGS
jgi:hypothetical protein